MKSKVFLIKTQNDDPPPAIIEKITRLLEESHLLDFIKSKSRVAVKMHFGEKGNTGYVKAEYVGRICEHLIKKGSVPFLADTNTLYKGERSFCDSHLRLAQSHGFIESLMHAEVVIPDENKKENNSEVIINQKYIKKAKLASIFLDSDFLVGIAHFKGHVMTGFGGALKNIGMGCATREGKLNQHSDVSPAVSATECIGCGECERICPVSAIKINNKKASLDKGMCIGCASCIAVCPQYAIEVKWETGEMTIQQKMAEYCLAILKNKKGKAVFINFAIKITKECDCIAQDDPRIVSDIGILASYDPVSLDKASFDLVNNAAGEEIFKREHPLRDGMIQLKHASEIGVGSLDYELIKIK